MSTFRTFVSDLKSFLPNEPKRKTPERSANITAKEQMRKQVKLEPFSKPPMLKPGMLFRVKWEDIWYECRYLTQSDGSAVAYSFVDGAFTPIDLEDDEWSFGPYTSVRHGDKINIEEIDTRVQAKWAQIDVHWEEDDSIPELLLPHNIKDDAPAGKSKPMIPQEEVLHGAEPTLAIVQNVENARGSFSYRKPGSEIDLTCLVWYERYTLVRENEDNVSDVESDISSDEEEDDIIVRKDGKDWYVVEGVSAGESKEPDQRGPPAYTLFRVDNEEVTKSISRDEYAS